MSEDAGASTATDSASTAGREAELGQMDRLMREPPKPGNGGMGDARPVTAAEMAAARRANEPRGQAAPGADDQSAEAMLADAMAGDGTAGGDGTGDDPAAQLKKAQADFAKLQRQSRNWEIRAKENAEKAKAHDAYVESQKTEQQKLADRAEQAELRAAQAEQRYLRTMAAASYDLPIALIDRLAGSTEDEINASAEGLAAAINERAAVLAAAQAQAAGNGTGQPAATARAAAQNYRPVESMRPGALPASDNKPANPNTWLRDQLAAKRAQ